MLHDGKAAAAEFQKFIDHYGLVVNFPWGALARLGLARAYARAQGRTRDKARTAYQDFLTLWKDADPDIPILKQAKAEYAKLTRAPLRNHDRHILTACVDLSDWQQQAWSAALRAHEPPLIDGQPATSDFLEAPSH